MSESSAAARRPEASEDTRGRLKAFSALVSQGAAIIRSRSMPEGVLGASFGELPGFWRVWSDGAHQPETARAAVGGVVVDEEGAAVAAFSEESALGAERHGAVLTEQMALERALRLAWAAGARKLEARFDCMPLARVAAAALMGESEEPADPQSASLLAIMSQFECLALRWTPRESNRLADALSKRPLGGGLFHGGASQSHLVGKAWANPAEGLAQSGDRERGEGRRRELRESPPVERAAVSAEGVVKLAVGARWREGDGEGGWIAAASVADPVAKREARLEASGSWALGSSVEPGPAGMAAALSQALAKKAAAVAARAGGRIEKFSLYLPEAVIDPLRQAGLLDGFVSASLATLISLAPGSAAQARPVEEGNEVAARQANHLLNGWELGRAAMMQQLRGARAQKRLEKARRGMPPSPA